MHNKADLPGRALSSEDKKEVLDRILKVWLENPLLRLGQLIECSVGYRKSCNLFNVEDDVLCEGIENFNSRNGR